MVSLQDCFVPENCLKYRNSIHCPITEIELESGQSATLDRLNFFGNEVASNEESKYLATVKAKSATVTCWKLNDKIISNCMRKMKAVMEGKSSFEEEE